VRSLRTPPASNVAVVAVLIGLLAVGTVVAAIGASLWLLCFVSLVALTCAIAQRISWTLAMTASVLIPLWLLTLAIRVYPVIGIDMNTANIVGLVAVSSIAIGSLLVRRDPIVLPPRPTIRTAALVAISPALIGLVAVFVGFASGWTRISWAMNSDAIWNTMMARGLYEDGGVAGASAGNAAPLTVALMAAALGPGRGSATKLLAHDVGREAELWVLAIMLVSALAGLTVAQAVRNGTTLRVLGVGVAGLFVATWYVAGFSFQYGFYNVMPAIAVLLSSWIVWMESRRAPVIAAAIQFLTGTVLLATWAPLAAVPVVLGVMTLVVHTAPALRHRGPVSLAITIAAIVQFVLYATLVSLADLGGGGAALSGTGAMAPVTPAILFILAGALLCAAVLQSTGRTDRSVSTGLFAVCAAAVLAYGFLAWQLRGPAKMWGYYPAKFVWLVSIVMVVLLIAASFRIISRGGRRGARTWIATAGVFVLIGGVIGAVPPSLMRLGALLPVADIVREKGASARDEAAAVLFDLSESDAPVIVARLSEDPGDDYFINGWLLQTQAESSDDPIRRFAYYLNAEDPVQVCGAIEELGDGAVVHTSDGAFEGELRSECAAEDFSVLLVPTRGS
jgi:hypothetical protein